MQVLRPIELLMLPNRSPIACLPSFVKLAPFSSIATASETRRRLEGLFAFRARACSLMVQMVLVVRMMRVLLVELDRRQGRHLVLVVGGGHGGQRGVEGRRVVGATCGQIAELDRKLGGLDRA